MHLVKTKFITEDLIILAWEMEVARAPAPTQVAPDACVNVTECLPMEWGPAPDTVSSEPAVHSGMTLADSTLFGVGAHRLPSPITCFEVSFFPRLDGGQPLADSSTWVAWAGPLPRWFIIQLEGKPLLRLLI